MPLFVRSIFTSRSQFGARFRSWFTHSKSTTCDGVHKLDVTSRIRRISEEENHIRIRKEMAQKIRTDRQKTLICNVRD
jgi:hypothetical protein